MWNLGITKQVRNILENILELFSYLEEDVRAGYRIIDGSIVPALAM